MLTQFSFSVKIEICAPSDLEVNYMAKTKSSQSGKQQKKIVPVKPYKKSDGTSVKGHRRSTPN